MSKKELISNNKIQEAINCLEEIKTHITRSVSIMVETSEDEAILVGTKDAYIILAKKLLDAVAKMQSTDEGKTLLDKIEAQIIPLQHVFNPLGHVVPSSICLAENEENYQEIVDFFQKL